MKLEIKKTGINGEGIGYYNRKPVFIDGCFPGEVADVTIAEDPFAASFESADGIADEDLPF